MFIVYDVRYPSSSFQDPGEFVEESKKFVLELKPLIYHNTKTPTPKQPLLSGVVLCLCFYAFPFQPFFLLSRLSGGFPCYVLYQHTLQAMAQLGTTVAPGGVLRFGAFTI